MEKFDFAEKGLFCRGCGCTAPPSVLQFCLVIFITGLILGTLCWWSVSKPDPEASCAKTIANFQGRYSVLAYRKVNWKLKFRCTPQGHATWTSWRWTSEEKSLPLTLRWSTDRSWTWEQGLTNASLLVGEILSKNSWQWANLLWTNSAKATM